MQRKLRRSRIRGQSEGPVDRWHPRERPAGLLTQGDDPLTRCTRECLRNECRRLALEISNLGRRAVGDAPEVCDRLRQAAEALQLLGARLALVDEPPSGRS